MISRQEYTDIRGILLMPVYTFLHFGFRCQESGRHTLTPERCPPVYITKKCRIAWNGIFIFRIHPKEKEGKLNGPRTIKILRRDCSKRA